MKNNTSLDYSFVDNTSGFAEIRSESDCSSVTSFMFSWTNVGASHSILLLCRGCHGSLVLPIDDGSLILLREPHSTHFVSTNRRRRSPSIIWRFSLGGGGVRILASAQRRPYTPVAALPHMTRVSRNIPDYLSFSDAARFFSST